MMLSSHGGREEFLAVTGEPWAPFRLMRDWPQTSTTPEDQVRALAEEARILDLVVSYVSSHDAKDLDWTLSTFTSEDEERRAALAQRYTMYNYLTHNFSRHRIANLVVRLLPGGSEAWLTGYWHVSRSGYPGDVTARFGHYFWRVTKAGGEWKIADRRGAGVEPYDAEFEDDDVNPAPPSALTSDFQLAAGWLEAERALWQRPADPDDLRRLLDDRSARELLAFYSYALDSEDWEWLESLFTVDAVLVVDGETFRGKAAVVSQLRDYRAGVRQSAHRYANPVIRTSDDEGWLACSFHFSTVGDDNRRSSTFGRYVGRLTRAGNGWRIAEWRIIAAPPLALKPASDRSRRISMPDIPRQRERFDLTVNRGAWAARRWLIDMPVAGDGQLATLTRQLELRELLTGYAAAMDAKDAEWVMSFFSADAVVTSATGRFRGKDRIRPYVDAKLVDGSTMLRRLMNVAVRLAPDAAEAWALAYVYDVWPALQRAGDGHLVARAVREDGVWKLADLVVSTDRVRFFPAS